MAVIRRMPSNVRRCGDTGDGCVFGVRKGMPLDDVDDRASVIVDVSMDNEELDDGDGSEDGSRTSDSCSFSLLSSSIDVFGAGGVDGGSLGTT